MKHIPLHGKRGDGKFALVDDEDFEKVTKHSWSLDLKGYVRAGVRREGKNISLRIHRVIMNEPRGMQIDHKDGNKLDNRKKNLRVCTNAENCRNRNRYKGSTNISGNKGVYWHKQNKKWVVMIKVNQKIYYLGSFDRKEDAVSVYNNAAKKYFGEFAKLN